MKFLTILRGSPRLYSALPRHSLGFVDFSTWCVNGTPS
ncbi:hypothetical protein L917_10057 [Phytophthora nicotianae]|uniref:Uncharacterized protein n=1 Tax=Phytophthora nicotianae TaxID=4792 RepID=W2L410_PHYNI|nr:hypothetical protein L917_10057 [Phytophthora nicotianae]